MSINGLPSRYPRPFSRRYTLYIDIYDQRETVSDRLPHTTHTESFASFENFRSQIFPGLARNVTINTLFDFFVCRDSDVQRCFNRRSRVNYLDVVYRPNPCCLVQRHSRLTNIPVSFPIVCAGLVAGLMVSLFNSHTS